MMHRVQPVTSHSKEILNDSPRLQETLSVDRRSVASHLTLTLSRRLVRYFSTVDVGHALFSSI
jgi:hypothetical protein